MTKAEVIMESLARMRVSEPIMLTQLFEAVHTAKDKKVKVPPPYVDYFTEKELIAWDSTEDVTKLDVDVITVILAIPWTKGEVPNLWSIPTISK